MRKLSIYCTFFQILAYYDPSKNCFTQAHWHYITKMQPLIVHRAKISIEHVKIAENDPKICKKKLDTHQLMCNLFMTTTVK